LFRHFRELLPELSKLEGRCERGEWRPAVMQGIERAVTPSAL